MSKSLQAVKLRNDFYRDNFRRVVLILLISVILNVALCVTVYFYETKPTKVLYFAVTSTGKLFKMRALSSPVLGASQLKSWVTRNVPQIYTLDYVHFKDQLNASRKYFTSYGWSQFIQAFQPTLNKVISGNYVVSAAVTDVPYIAGTAVINGKYTWKVQVPVKITFRKGDTASTNNVIWQLVLQRVNNAKSDQFVGISQIVQTTAQ